MMRTSSSTEMMLSDLSLLYYLVLYAIYSLATASIIFHCAFSHPSSKPKVSPQICTHCPVHLCNNNSLQTDPILTEV